MSIIQTYKINLPFYVMASRQSIWRTLIRIPNRHINLQKLEDCVIGYLNILEHLMTAYYWCWQIMVKSWHYKKAPCSDWFFFLYYIKTFEICKLCLTSYQEYFRFSSIYAWSSDFCLALICFLFKPKDINITGVGLHKAIHNSYPRFLQIYPMVT